MYRRLHSKERGEFRVNGSCCGDVMAMHLYYCSEMKTMPLELFGKISLEQSNPKPYPRFCSQKLKSHWLHGMGVFSTCFVVATQLERSPLCLLS